jgi:hypothetical protein
MNEELEDLRDSKKELELQNFDLKEAELSEKYLVDLIGLIDARTKKSSTSPSKSWFWN